MIPTGKPIASARSERCATSGRRWTSATQRPAIGPNSGPTIIAPTIRIGESRKIPTAAIMQASAMKARKTPFSSMFSEVRDSTSSQTTASPGHARRRPARPLAATAEIAESMCSIAIEPSVSMSSSRRSETITLASSRATSQRITSPSGLRAARSRKITLQADGVCSSRSRTCSDWYAGTTIRMWTMRGLAYPRVLTDYHLHLRPDDADATAERVLHRGERRALPGGGGGGRDRRARRLRARPPLHRGARDLGPPVLARERARRPRRLLRVRALDPAAARDRDGLRPRPRGPDRQRARRPRVRLRGRLGPLRRRRRRRLGRLRRLGAARPIPTGSGGATSRRSPRRRAPASTTSSPTPTWSSLGPRAAAARARPALPLRAGDRGDRRDRDRGRGLDRRAGASRSTSSTRPTRSPRCASTPGAAFALSSDAHVPEDVGHEYDRAVETMRGWGVEEICVFERRERRLEPLG